MVTVGNHELLDGDSGGEDGVPYATRFNMPGDGSNIFDMKLFYSFTHRYVKFIQIATDVDYGVGTTQFNWLEKELSEVDRTLTPWVIVSGHKPMYCSSTFGSNDRNDNTGRGNAGDLTKELEPLMQKYQVDVFLAGHIHAYERTKPVTNNGTSIDEDCIEKGTINNGVGDVYRNPKYTTHLLLGMAGAGHLGDTFNILNDTAWPVFSEQAWGFMRMTFHNASAFQMEFVGNGNGFGLPPGSPTHAGVHDAVMIIKDL
tara:strand:- start:31 stop:801 length:771 start_codon:yes stop_codon:yes gene_type:complete